MFQAAEKNQGFNGLGVVSLFNKKARGLGEAEEATGLCTSKLEIDVHCTLSRGGSLPELGPMQIEWQAGYDSFLRAC